MNQLIIHADNKYCQFISSDTAQFNLLRNFLSFKTVGVEFTPSFQQGFWNGITYLMNKKGMFFSGLLTKVRQFLQGFQIAYTEIDKRKPIVENLPIDISAKLETLGLVPREHQIRILNSLIANNKGIVRAATSSGKTLVTAMATAHFNKPTIIYVIGLDLLQQFHDLYSKIFDEPIGFIGNGVCQIERINIASIWSIGSALKIGKEEMLVDDDESNTEIFDESNATKIINMLEQAKVHIIDESHIVVSNTMSKIYKTIDPERIYGFSGTPFRDDNTDLLINGILGEKIVEVNATELIEKGIIAQPIIKFVSVPTMTGGDQPYQTIYKNYITENHVRNSIIVDQTKELLEKNYRPLVLFKHLRHGDMLLEMMRDSGIKCEMLNGSDSLDRRTEIKDKIINGEIQTILASTIFDIGIDLPILNALVLCGSGKSSIRALQRIGRVIRAYPNKKYAAVVDFYDQTKFLKKHSMIRYNIYCSEKGFKVIKSKNMKK